MPSVEAVSSSTSAPAPHVELEPWEGSNERSRFHPGALFALTFVMSVAYMYLCLNKGWLPQDDGQLAQGALRVLNGQLPHRDFVENYTGGLNYLHALAFWCFGIKLTALRYCVFLTFVAWLPAVLYLGCRLVSVPAAAVMTLLAVAWSLPIYPAAMPSWYNLVFATLGAAALFRYLEADARRWLFLAGLCGGLSILVKVVGLYYVAAVLLFFVFREQSVSETSNEAEGRSSYGYQIFSIAGLLGFMAAIVALLSRGRFGFTEFMHFVLPSGALVILLIAREWRMRTGGNRARFGHLFGMVAPFTAGLLMPIVVYLVPYAWSGSVQAFVQGVFIQGLRSASSMATVRPLNPLFLIFPGALLLLLARAIFWPMGALRTLIVSGALVSLLLVPKNIVWRVIWVSASESTLAVVLLSAAVLLLKPSFTDNLSKVRRQQLLLLSALAAVCGLVQFPFAAPIYFFYFAPLTVFAFFVLISARRRPASRYVLGSVAVFFLLFAVCRIQPSRAYYAWFFPEGHLQSRGILALPRSGGLKVENPDVYKAVVEVVQQHASNGLLIATPECPELYFLTGLRNPATNDGGLEPADLLRALRTNGLTVVVIKELHTFGGALAPVARDAITRDFPHSAEVGVYTVYWKE